MGGVLICNLIKTSPPIFHWAQAAPTRYKDRNHSLQPFQRNYLLKCVSQPEIANNLLKSPILRVQSHSRSSMLTPLRSSLSVLVSISRMSVPICSCFRARRANIRKITTLYRGTPLRRSRAQASLKVEPKRSALGLLKSAFNVENFICWLSWSVFTHFVAIHSWDMEWTTS